MVLQSKGSRPLIFSQWTSVLDILGWLLETMGLPYVRLDGSTVVAERLSTVDRSVPHPFHTPSTPLPHPVHTLHTPSTLMQDSTDRKLSRLLLCHNRLLQIAAELLLCHFAAEFIILYYIIFIEVYC